MVTQLRLLAPSSRRASGKGDGERATAPAALCMTLHDMTGEWQGRPRQHHQPTDSVALAERSLHKHRVPVRTQFITLQLY